MPEFPIDPFEALRIIQIRHSKRQFYGYELRLLVGTGIKFARHRAVIPVLQAQKQRIISQNIQEEKTYQRDGYQRFQDLGGSNNHSN